MRQRLLLIANDTSNVSAVHEALNDAADDFEIERVKCCAEGLERLMAAGKQGRQGPKGFAAVLLDLFLPDCEGIESFERVFRAMPDIPMFILSSPEHEPIARQAVQRGAQDYLLRTRLDSYSLPKALHSMIERAANAEALFDEKERAQVTLNSIGDAVMTIDTSGHVTYLNVVAEKLTGWTRTEAAGRPVEEVFRIVNSTTRETATNPMEEAIRENKAVGLTADCILIRRDGVETAIEDSIAPIHDRRGDVTGAVMVFHDVGLGQTMSLKMSHLAQHDSLTELPNRLLFNDRLAQAMASARRHHGKLAVLFLDLDHFKVINDSRGHQIGDCLLQSVARRLLTCVRGADTISRQGGDEFVILLSEIAHALDAGVCAEKILAALSLPHYIDQHALQVTASIGIVTYPDDGADVEALLKHADVAMYAAKKGGRGNYQFFQPEMNTHVVERQSLERGLHQALERGEFELHYQPIVSMEKNSVTGIEALIRWRHPQRGLIAPTQFVSIAEELGLIVPIGQWVLREACRQSRVWQQAGLPPVRIAINISAVELRHKDFVAGVRSTLSQSGLDPRCLELELTEAFLMQDKTLTATVLQGLKDVGVQLALDDFGTGYCSLNQLKHLPIDTLKIDQSFVHNLTSNADDDTIVSAVIGMGLGLRLRIVAEGVETAAQLDFLRQHRCPEGQGYYFQRPATGADIVCFLKRAVAQGRAKGQTRLKARRERLAAGHGQPAP